MGTYLVTILNGPLHFPAARPGRPYEDLSVRMRIQWVPVDLSDADVKTSQIPLRRDIPPSTRYFQTVVLANPEYRGSYDLVAELEQVGNPGAFKGKGKVHSTRIALRNCAAFLPEGLKEGACVA